MSVVQKAVSTLPGSEERRRFQRVRVNLLGRYMLLDRREFPCQVVEMSPGGMALVAPVSAKPGERVIAYIDHLGRLEGAVTRTLPNGFAMTIAATARKRDKLAAQLTWIANRHILGLPEDRRHGRQSPRNTRTTVILPNGVTVTCHLIDVSLSGAAVHTDARPPVGSLITVGRTQARVVRHRDDGIGVEFTRLQHPDFLEENVASE
ncbi:MAG TPA: PilZ domain-containing protein [Xanthobacteraceae bacterium]|nr:PilZ domain-containing protein [Xanthobacteraceae bacterium]